MRVVLIMLITLGLAASAYARCDYEVSDACDAEIVEIEKANDDYRNTDYKVVVEVTNDTDCLFRDVRLKCDIIDDEGTVLGTQHYYVPGIPPNGYYEVETYMQLPMYADPDEMEFEFEFY